ncbi:MAG TPA: nuclear transport factor 2 family protein [Janthinobacterium sp.]|jgi:ketosteroid isomerase-like protein|nr:nuclear transport factor 2 family protein [Janthinobacterium sp.]
MDTKQNKQLVMQAYEMYKNKDIKGILALCDDKVEWIGPESEFIPFAGSHHGKDQVAQFFSKLEQAQDIVRFEPQDFIAEGDKVAVTGAAAWHVKGTGQTYDTPWAHVFTLRNGKIARFEQYPHTAAAEAAFRPAQAAGASQTKPMQH